MLKHKSDEASCDRGLSALALAGHLGASAPCSSCAVRAAVARNAAALSGGESSVTELDPIELSDDDCFDEVVERREGFHSALVLSDNERVLVDGPSAVVDASAQDVSCCRAVCVATTDVVKASASHVDPKGGIVDGIVFGTSALAEGIVSATYNVVSQAAGSRALQTNVSSVGLGLVVEAELVSASKLSEPVGAGTAKRPRTRWGRCGVLLCQAPLRLLVDHTEGRPFLGCSRWKSSNPASCKFRMAFPADRCEELPPRMKCVRCIDW
jgi:hypothetical protein